jgi:hypothetical protein
MMRYAQAEERTPTVANACAECLLCPSEPSEVRLLENES